MFTALEIVFSCTFCILNPFIGMQSSLHKCKGKSQQFRLLSYSAEINGDRLSLWNLFFSGWGSCGALYFGPKLRALQLLISPLDQDLLFTLWRREFQISWDFSPTPFNGCWRHAKVFAALWTTGFPKVLQGKLTPLKFKPEFLHEGCLPSSVLWWYCSSTIVCEGRGCLVAGGFLSLFLRQSLTM